MRFVRDAVITLSVMVVVVSIVIYSTVKDGGLSAEDTPGRIEQSVAGRLVRLSIPQHADRQSNPYGHEAGAWRQATEHYGDHCAVCHGRDGHGRTEIGANMYPKVPDLASPSVQRLSDGALFYIIQNGVRWTGMPGWKSEHAPDETWKLVALVRKAPTLTSDEWNARMSPR